MRLKYLLNSSIPLIAIHTTDVLNIKDILIHAVQKKGKKIRFLHVPSNTTVSKIHNLIQTYGYMVEPEDTDFNLLYTKLEEEGKTLVLVNPDFAHDAIYDLGYVSTPISLIEARLKDLLEDGGVIKYFLPILKDLTLKQVDDIIKLSTNIYGEISEESLRAVKRQYNSLSSGIQDVDVTLPFYYAIPQIEEWLSTQGKILLKDVPRSLKPRGLLLEGKAGTGKTFSAKRIANELKIPLYRLDIGSLMGKYVGQSEKNLEKALNTLESASPCVALLDEVEKLFSVSDDSGVSNRLLGQLLWWLQEHRFNIITVMTTNNKDILPPELYRAGRIDTSIEFKHLSVNDGKDFASHVLAQYEELIDIKAMQGVFKKVIQLFNQHTAKDLTYAKITERVVSEIRKKL